MSATIDENEIDRENQTTVETAQQADWLSRAVQVLMAVYLLPVIVLVMVVAAALAGLLATFALLGRGAKWLEAHSRPSQDLPFRPLGSPNLRLNRSDSYVPNARAPRRKSNSL